MQILFLLALLLVPQQIFDLARPERELRFPDDHGSHSDFKTEWWYFTGHFDTDSGRRFGFELTFFRVALEDVPENPSAWRPVELYPAHFAISDLDEEKFTYHEKIARPGGGLAGARSGDLDVWVHNWFARRRGDTFEIRAAVPGLALDLQLENQKPPVLHGENGFSRKGPGPNQASHYYSLTRLTGAGELTIAGETHRGQASAWMDHEFMSNVLSQEQVGWDWFSLQFESGQELMLFQIRQQDGSPSLFSSGTWVKSDGENLHLSLEEFSLEPLEYWQSPASGARYPIRWRIRLPAQEMELEVTAAIANQELLTIRSTGVVYWEGAVEARGSRAGQTVAARGYLEMTGYSGTRPSL